MVPPALPLPTARDREAFDEVANVIRTRRALAMVGAGVSRGLRYPDWQELLDAMHARLDKAPDRAQRASRYLKAFGDQLWRAEEYRRRLGTDYFAFLSDTFKQDRGTNSTTRAIVKLPFRHIFTTNYDSSLERAAREVRRRPLRSVRWDREEELLEFLYRFHEPSFRRLVYVHGHWDSPTSIVLSDADYTARYVRTEGASKRLFALFAMQRFVFFGFSLSDPDLSAIMREVNVAVGSKDKARHFAFIGLGARDDREVHRSRMLLKFGIQPIFYDARDGHQALDVLLGALLTGACAQSPQPARPPVRSRAAGRTLRGVVADAERTLVPRPLPPLPRVSDPTDPQKDRFGGLSARDNWVLSAAVTESTEDDGWYEIRLDVRSKDSRIPLQGPVRFHLHDTFVTPLRTVRSKGGAATLELRAYGAFTVGVELVHPKVRLELDLSELKSAPREFRLN